MHISAIRFGTIQTQPMDPFTSYWLQTLPDSPTIIPYTNSSRQWRQLVMVNDPESTYHLEPKMDGRRIRAMAGPGNHASDFETLLKHLQISPLRKELTDDDVSAIKHTLANQEEIQTPFFKAIAQRIVSPEAWGAFQRSLRFDEFNLRNQRLIDYVTQFILGKKDLNTNKSY